MLKRIIQTIYPSCCILCGGPGLLNRDLCAACEQDLPRNTHACRRCAIPLPDVADQQLCGQCIKKKPLYDSAWSPFLYAQPVEWVIQQIKFNARLSYASVLSELLVKHVPDVARQADCIIPVPLHVKRFRERGFNQSLELVRLLARHVNIPIDDKSCTRKKYSAPQMGMSAKQRRKNIKHVFEFNNEKNYRHVVLFDDVITTGSTVAELTRTIKRQGVKRVDIWSLARAEKKYR